MTLDVYMSMLNTKTLTCHIYILNTLLNAKHRLPLSPRSLTTKTVVVSTSKAHSEAWRLSVENGLCAPDIYKDPLGCCYKRLDFSIDQRLAVYCISYSLRTPRVAFPKFGLLDEQCIYISSPLLC